MDSHIRVHTLWCVRKLSWDIDSGFMQMLTLLYVKDNLSAQSNYSALRAWASAQPAGEPDKQTSENYSGFKHLNTHFSRAF